MKIAIILISFIITAYTNTFKDKNTDLIWQTNPSTSNYTWQEAKNHCDNLKYNYKNDWRLPNIDELMSLTDKTKYKPAITTKKIKIKTDDWYWTSSSLVSDPKGAWYVYFKYGSGYWDGKGNKYYALCVRGQ